MELRHLRYFVVVADEQNVTRAAQRLHVSQPPLSRQIRDLEGEIGVPLFRRTAKSITLTEAGKIFLNDARLILLQVDRAVQAVRTVATSDRGHIRIGYAPSLTVALLPRALRALEQETPGVRVSLHDLSTEECVQKLFAGKIDLALTVQPSAASMKGLIFDRVVRYPICCAAATTHPLARKRTVSIAELQREKLLGYSQEDYPEYFFWMAKLFDPIPLNRSAVEQYDSATGLIAAVEAGRGVALVSLSMKCLTGPRVKLLPIVPAIPSLVVGALTGRTKTALTTRFVAAVKSVA